MTTNISVLRRDDKGKGAARRLRREGRIPAVIYGEKRDAVSLSLDPKELVQVLKSEHGQNSLIELEVGGNKQPVLLSGYQHHPVSRKILHADFKRINLEEPVEVRVPFELTGKAKGVVMGGTLRQVFRRLPVRCLPTNIPVKLSHDVTELGLDEAVQVKDLSLPDGVEVRFDEARTVAAIVTERRRAAEEEAAEAAPGGAEGGDPAAAGAAAGDTDKKA